MNYCKRIVFCILFVLAVLICSCSRTESIVEVSSSSANIDLPVDSETLNSGDLDSWIGEYSFFEQVSSMPHDLEKPYMFESYHIKIFKENENYYADIYVDGHMTMVRWEAKVSGDENRIEFILYDYLPDAIHKYCNIGDLLLSFRRDELDILTEWGALKPMLLENETTGVYFVSD